MESALLQAMLAFETRAAQANLNGLTHDDALAQPPGGGNCVNWMLGHIVTHRNHMLRLMGRGPVWGAELDARYDRGSAPVTDGDGAVPLDQLLEAMERARAALSDGFAEMTPERLAEETGRGGPLGQRLALMLGHELYHVGQISILRRLLGHPGAIK
ncbi:MAG TPA: DinB family protein [Longimicrobium sp.]